MECNHKPSLDQTVTLITRHLFKSSIPYTCDKCGHKCELSLPAGFKALSLIAAFISAIIIEVLFVTYIKTRFMMFNVLLYTIGLCTGLAVWYGLMLLMVKMNKVTYVSVQEYRPIVNRISLKRR